MNLQQQIEWLEKQINYSKMLGDPHIQAYEDILESLHRLKGLEK